MIVIHKSHSKNELFDLINLINIPIIFSHCDNKKQLHTKLNDILETTFEIKQNHYHIKSIDDLKIFLKNKNPKKTLSVKEKNDVMIIAKHVINYCKNGFHLEYSYKYTDYKQIEDDMDFIKQFGDIPSVRRCCRLLKEDPYFIDNDFTPLISPQCQRVLDTKMFSKKVKLNCLKIKRGTKEEPIIVLFD